jgi:ATP phosphoribosyltransferase regulatory subunit HisZ
MPLLTPLQSINARLADDARQAANHIANASVIANRMVAAMLQLNDEQLTAWLNSQPPEYTKALFAAHGQLGSAINSAGDVAQAVLSESGVTVNIPAVDVRSVADKLADQRRVLSFVDGLFAVSTLPEPEPELEPHFSTAPSDLDE